MNYLSTEADGGLGYLDSEVSGGSGGGGGGGATDVTAAVAGDFLARIKEAADAGYRLSIGLDSDGQPVLVLGSGAAIDSRIKRTAAKTITVDDGAGGAITLNVIGTVQQGGAALLTRTAADAVYASLGSGFTDPTALTGDMIYRPVTTGVDKAAGKSVTSSSSGNRYIGPRLTDGDDTNFVYGGNDVGAEYAILDLTAAQTIASWRAVFGNTDANGLTLSYSTDGITFTAIDSTLASGTVRVFAAPTTARYWQLSRTGGATYLGLATLNLYAPSTTTLVRLPVGSAGQSLGIAGGVPAWITPAARTGGFAVQPLDRTTFDATYGDDFDGAALNARWTRVTQGSGEETYQKGPRGSALRVTYNTGAATRYIYQAAPAGDWTFETCLTNWQPLTTNQMFGLLAVDASGNGVAALLYDNPQGFYLANITAGAYASQLYQLLSPTEIRGGRRHWLRLRKASGVYAASYSLDGENYSPEVSSTPSAFTLARIGIGRLLGTDAADVVDWHWFDKTA